MKEIILTEEQARQIAESKEPVELRDVAGTVLVKVDPFDATALAAHRQRRQSELEEQGVPGDKVHEYLQLLQAEWDKNGPFDMAKADEIFARMNVREE
jgi:hypothetical protein